MASIFDLLLAQQTGRPMDDPLSALLASQAMPMPQAPAPAIPPFIDLRGERPQNQIAGAPNIMDLLKGLWNSGAPAAQPDVGGPLPGMMPPPRPPGPMPLPAPGAPVPPPPLIDTALTGARDRVGALVAQSAQAPITPESLVAAIAPPPAAPAGPPPRPVTWGLPPSATQAGPKSMTISPTGAIEQPGAVTVSPGAPITADPMAAAMSLIRQREGFKDSAYYDVDAHRVGFGSDTVTLPDGTVQKVSSGTKTTQADAERDLSRRTGEFMGSVRTSIGEEAFNKLNATQIGALTSLTYNYGTLPESVAKAAQSGDPEAIAKSIEGLKGHNKGINSERRQQEADLIRGTTGLNTAASNAFAMPTPRERVAPNLPLPGQTEALKGLDPKVFEALLGLKPTAMNKLSTGDKIGMILGSMAKGAQGAKNMGDLLLGMGAGGGAGASANIMLERGDQEKFNQAKDALAKLAAQTEVSRGEAAQQGQNYQIQARNRDNDLLNQVKTEQAKLDTAAKNAMAEVGDRFDLKKWEYFQPQVHATSDGVTVITRTPQGGLKVNSTKLNDMKADAERITEAAKLFGKDSKVVDTMRYTALREKGEPYMRQQILQDAVEGNHIASILGDEEYKKLEVAAKKGIPPVLLGKPEEYTKELKERMTALLWEKFNPKSADERKKIDNLWLPYMLQKGNIGAAMLAQPGV